MDLRGLYSKLFGSDWRVMPPRKLDDAEKAIMRVLLDNRKVPKPLTPDETLLQVEKAGFLNLVVCVLGLCDYSVALIRLLATC